MALIMALQQGQTYFLELDPPPLAGTLQAKWPGPYKGKSLFSKALNKFKGSRGKRGFMPSVLFALLHRQAVGFSSFLELLVVVGARPEGSEDEPFHGLGFHRFLQKAGSGIRRTD